MCSDMIVCDTRLTCLLSTETNQMVHQCFAVAQRESLSEGKLKLNFETLLSSLHILPYFHHHRLPLQFRCRAADPIFHSLPRSSV